MMMMHMGIFLCAHLYSNFIHDSFRCVMLYLGFSNKSLINKANKLFSFTQV